MWSLVMYLCFGEGRQEMVWLQIWKEPTNESQEQLCLKKWLCWKSCLDVEGDTETN